MTDTKGEVRTLIKRIETVSISDKAKVASIALINVIPYAGGAIASIIGEIASQRKFEKVCEVLSDLNDKLEEHGTDPEAHLSKDQVVEVVHEAVATAAVSSDQKKIDALKRGLAYAFISDDSFEKKQLYLKILRELTTLEIALLLVVYESSDPYRVEQGYPTSDLNDASRFYGQISAGILVGPQGHWQAMSNIDDSNKPVLAEFLAKKINVDRGAAEGALCLLDAKGLTAAGPNLNSKHSTIFQWVPQNPRALYLDVGTTALGVVTTPVKPTPLESSRTEFGRTFLRFFERY